MGWQAGAPLKRLPPWVAQPERPVRAYRGRTAGRRDEGAAQDMSGAAPAPVDRRWRARLDEGAARTCLAQFPLLTRERSGRPG